MHWTMHLTRMEDVRQAKQLFYGNTIDVQDKPKKRFKDIDKNKFRMVSIGIGNWEQMTVN